MEPSTTPTHSHSQSKEGPNKLQRTLHKALVAPHSGVEGVRLALVLGSMTDGFPERAAALARLLWRDQSGIAEASSALALRALPGSLR